MESFFFNDTATTEIYTLSLHDALPISASCANRKGTSRSTARRTRARQSASASHAPRPRPSVRPRSARFPCRRRSEEHTSELQSRQYLVCRLLLEKKKKTRALAITFQHF